MTLNQKLATAAGALALIALVLSARTPSSDVDLAALARAVEREEDHVDAIELAEWLRAQKPDLRVIDIRSAQEFQEYHIPTAQNVSLPRIMDVSVKPDETVVLYSEGGTHAAQAWFFLKAGGAKDVFFLRGGLNEWMDSVMNPALPVSDRTRQVMEYFGGIPSAGGSSSGETIRERVGRIKGRTC